MKLPPNEIIFSICHHFSISVKSCPILEIVFSRAPTDLANTSATIYVDEIYGNAIVDFVLYRAYMKDAEYASNTQRAGQHYQLFAASLGQGAQAQTLLDPNMDPITNTPVAAMGGN